MINVNNYIRLSTILGIFSEAASFNYIIDIKLFYLILVINTLLILATKPLKFSPNHLFILGFLLVHGLLGVLLIKYPATSLISQLVGIGYVSTYFYLLLKYFDIRKLFLTYVKVSLVMSIIGIIMYYSNISLWDEERLHGLLNEPSRFVILILPAFYYYLKTKQTWKWIIIGFSLVMAQSSLGYIGLGLMILLPNLKLKYLKNLAYAIPILVLFVWFLSKNENFQLRYQETVESLDIFESKKFIEKPNMSTYALLANSYVAFNNFIDHPLGTGLGSFKFRHDVYIQDLTIPRHIEKLDLIDLNRDDANSLFLRMLSDLGVFGLLLIGLFTILAINAFRREGTAAIIAQAMVVYLILKLLRQGHYFSHEFFYFFWTFIFIMGRRSDESFNTKTE